MPCTLLTSLHTGHNSWHPRDPGNSSWFAVDCCHTLSVESAPSADPNSGAHNHLPRWPACLNVLYYLTGMNRLATNYFSSPNTHLHDYMICIDYPCPALACNTLCSYQTMYLVYKSMRELSSLNVSCIENPPNMCPALPPLENHHAQCTQPLSAFTIANTRTPSTVGPSSWRGAPGSLSLCCTWAKPSWPS